MRPAGVKPGSVRWRFQKLRSSSAAPIVQHDGHRDLRDDETVQQTMAARPRSRRGPIR